MASIWNGPKEITQLVTKLKKEHHPHLALASVWVLCSYGPAIRDNRLVATVTQKCTKTEKLASGHDFKITVMVEAWSHLTDQARKIAVDEALCRCSVKRVPATIEVNGRQETVKDDVGRTVYTEEFAYDAQGNPRWCLRKADAGIFFELVHRYGDYCQELENLHRVEKGQPIQVDGRTLFDAPADLKLSTA